MGLHTCHSRASNSGARIEIRCRFRVRDSQIEHIAWALMDEAQSGYPSGRLYLDCLATALAVQLLRNHSSLAALRPCRRYGMAPWKLRQVQCYIEENLRCYLSLDMIAEVARMSASHLKSTFRMASGMPVHRYVIRRRVERATAAASTRRATNQPDRGGCRFCASEPFGYAHEETHRLITC